MGFQGSFYIGPSPDQVVNLQVDGFWMPIALTDDTTFDAIPYPWTDAVQFYALFLAYTESQRKSDADAAFSTYEQFMQRSRGIVTPLREAKTFPGGVTARKPLGMAPPEVPPQGGQR